MKLTEKHIKTARRIAAEVSIPDYVPNVMFIASALADAEREGVERAAGEIATLRALLNSQYEAVDVSRENDAYVIAEKAIRDLSTHPENG